MVSGVGPWSLGSLILQPVVRHKHHCGWHEEENMLPSWLLGSKDRKEPATRTRQNPQVTSLGPTFPN